MTRAGGRLGSGTGPTAGEIVSACEAGASGRAPAVSRAARDGRAYNEKLAPYRAVTYKGGSTVRFVSRPGKDITKR